MTYRVRHFRGMDRSQDEVERSAGRLVTAENTDFFQEGAFSPRDGLARAAGSSTYDALVSPIRSLLAFPRSDRDLLVVMMSGTLHYVKDPAPEFDEDDF